MGRKTTGLHTDNSRNALQIGKLILTFLGLEGGGQNPARVSSQLYYQYYYFPNQHFMPVKRSENGTFNNVNI